MKKIIRNSIILILIDQLIKILVVNNIYQDIEIVNNFFSLTYVKNIGAAFSVLEGNRILFVIVALAALYLIYRLFIKNKKLTKLNIITYSLLIGGIIGNLIDRIIYGYVVDYFEFILFNHNMPIFNLADVCIVFGAFLFIIQTLKEENDERIHRR